MVCPGCQKMYAIARNFTEHIDECPAVMKIRLQHEAEEAAEEAREKATKAARKEEHRLKKERRAAKALRAALDARDQGGSLANSAPLGEAVSRVVHPISQEELRRALDQSVNAPVLATGELSAQLERLHGQSADDMSRFVIAQLTASPPRDVEVFRRLYMNGLPSQWSFIVKDLDRRQFMIRVPGQMPLIDAGAEMIFRTFYNCLRDFCLSVLQKVVSMDPSTQWIRVDQIRRLREFCAATHRKDAFVEALCEAIRLVGHC